MLHCLVLFICSWSLTCSRCSRLTPDLCVCVFALRGDQPHANHVQRATWDTARHESRQSTCRNPQQRDPHHFNDKWLDLEPRWASVLPQYVHIGCHLPVCCCARDKSLQSALYFKLRAVTISFLSASCDITEDSVPLLSFQNAWLNWSPWWGHMTK